MKMDLALNNLQRLIHHKTQTTTQLEKIKYFKMNMPTNYFKFGISVFIILYNVDFRSSLRY